MIVPAIEVSPCPLGVVRWALTIREEKASALDVDYRQFYDLESYLFDVVGQRFRDNGCLEAFDFFCIVIWKANRAKSRIARRLLDCGSGSLQDAVRALTEGLADLKEPKDRLQYLMARWGFRLPMASAILTVLYPDDFTVYDTRVCDSIGGFHSIGNRTEFGKLWDEYVQFRQAVEQATPQTLTLRDKDRYLWGKSFHDQLQRDITREFT